MKISGKRDGQEGAFNMIIVSACLAGLNCKYDGGNNHVLEIEKLVAQGKALPVCPEQLGGAPTPREAAEIRVFSGEDVLAGRARVMTKSGDDKTEAFIKGAEEVLKIARMAGAKQAILKERSPSCGCTYIYDGTFSGSKHPGRGVTAALLASKGIKVYSEETLGELFKE